MAFGGLWPQARQWLPLRSALCLAPGRSRPTAREAWPGAAGRPVRRGPPRPRASAAPAGCRCRGRARRRRRSRQGRAARQAGEAAADKPSATSPPSRAAAAALGLPAGADGGDRHRALSIPDIQGPGGCGGEDLVRLEAIVLPDKRKVAVKPAAILRCTMASAIADWIRTDIVPLAASLGSDDQRPRQFRFLRMPRPQPRRRRQALRARPRQCARRARAQARQRPVDLADRPHRAARVARKRAAFGLRAVFHRARAGLGLVSRGPHPSRPDGAAQQLPDLPVERLGSAAAGRAAVAGRAARRRRRRARSPPRPMRKRSRAKPDAAKSEPAKTSRGQAGAAKPKPTKKRR